MHETHKKRTKSCNICKSQIFSFNFNFESTVAAGQMHRLVEKRGKSGFFLQKFDMRQSSTN